MDEKEMRIRFEQNIRLYGSSPGVQITYKDFEMLYEDLLKILDITAKKTKIGFK